MGPKERTIRKKGSYDWPQSDQHCQQPALLKRAVSERYPGLNIRVVVDNPGPRLRGPADFTIRNGAYMP